MKRIYISSTDYRDVQTLESPGLLNVAVATSPMPQLGVVQEYVNRLDVDQLLSVMDKLAADYEDRGETVVALAIRNGVAAFDGLPVTQQLEPPKPTAIPDRVFWSLSRQDFRKYGSGSMGEEFYRKWLARKDEFPRE
jgi:hypothetical protein